MRPGGGAHGQEGNGSPVAKRAMHGISRKDLFAEEPPQLSRNEMAQCTGHGGKVVPSPYPTRTTGFR